MVVTYTVKTADIACMHVWIEQNLYKFKLVKLVTRCYLGTLQSRYTAHATCWGRLHLFLEKQQ